MSATTSHAHITPRAKKYALIGGLGLDAVVVGTIFIRQVGALLDAWAHINLGTLETFFTPWHAVFYGGFLTTWLVLGPVAVLNRLRSGRWSRSLPAGYQITIYGMLGFGVAGVGDMFWHILFGIERNADAAFSPTHLAISACAMLTLIGPWRSMEAQPSFLKSRASKLVFMLLVSNMFLIFMFPGMLFHPFILLWPSFTPKTDIPGQSLGMLALCFQSLLLVAMWLYLIYRKQAFSGLFAAVIMFQTISLYLMRGYWIVLPVGMAISVLTEAAFTWLQPSLQRPGALRLFAGCAAASFPLAYIIGLALSGPFLWSAHLAGGSVVVSGVLGYLMACMATPPPTRQQMVNEQPEYYRKEQIDATCCSDTAARDGVAGSTAGH